MTEMETATKITEVDARSKSNTHRIDDLEKRQGNLDSLVTSVAVIASKQEGMETDVTEIKADVKTLTGKPGKHWDEFVSKIMWAVAAALIGFLFAQIGLSG